MHAYQIQLALARVQNSCSFLLVWLVQRLICNYVHANVFNEWPLPLTGANLDYLYQGHWCIKIICWLFFHYSLVYGWQFWILQDYLHGSHFVTGPKQVCPVYHWCGGHVYTGPACPGDLPSISIPVPAMVPNGPWDPRPGSLTTWHWTQKPGQVSGLCFSINGDSSKGKNVYLDCGGFGISVIPRQREL